MSLHTLSTIVTVTTHIANVRPRTVPIERAEDKNSVRLAGVSVNDSCQNPAHFMGLTPVAGSIFCVENRAIFSETFFRREIPS